MIAKKPTSSDSAAKAAQKLGLSLENGSVKLDGQSIYQSLGGWLGILESVVPGSVFVLVYAISQDIVLAIVIGSLLSLGFIARQIVSGRPLSQAIVGALGIALAAFLALRPGGEAADYFIPGILLNLGYAVGLLLSALVRYPAIGLLIGFVRGTGLDFRKNRSLMRRMNFVTLLWAAMFGLRLAVQVPLYLSGSLAALGIVKVAMGIPLYAITAWMSWLVLKSAFRDQR